MGYMYSLPYSMATPAATDTLVYAIQGTAAMKLCIVDIAIGSYETADAAAHYSLRRLTAEHATPTGTQITNPYELDEDGPAASGWDGWFAVPNATGPTYSGTAATAPWKCGLNQRGMHRWCALPNRGFWIPKTNAAGLGLEVTSRTAAFGTAGHIHIEA